MNTGDTAFLMISAAFVMLMTPGLALFYAGMVRSKNTLGTIMQSFILIAVITLEWILWGYSMVSQGDWTGLASMVSAKVLIRFTPQPYHIRYS